jgi:hypothetical protein
MSSAKKPLLLQEMIEVTAASLHDSFSPLREEGEKIAGAFRMKQFLPDIEKDARDAPTVAQRESAHKILEHMADPF